MDPRYRSPGRIAPFSYIGMCAETTWADWSVSSAFAALPRTGSLLHYWQGREGVVLSHWIRETSVISDPVCPQSLCCPHKQLILSCCQRGFGVTPQSEASPCPQPKAHRQSSLESLVLSPGLPSWCADPFLSRVPPRF